MNLILSEKQSLQLTLYRSTPKDLDEDALWVITWRLGKLLRKL
jgi:hypothetical protein